MSARIKLLSADTAAVDLIAQAFELPRFLAHVLVTRGFDTPEKARAFLNPCLETDWRDPYEIDDMDRAVDALQCAVQDGKRILVFGDFDLDGISATTIMTRGLAAVGADAIPFIPLRFEEGYGLTPAAIERVLTHQPDMVVTVDNGIAACQEVLVLQEHGVEVVITDHHEPADQVPQGVPVVDPKQQDVASQILAGAGVALKTVQALGSRFGKPNLWLDLVDFATLGTVADLMPMVGENRALVSRGIRMINEGPRACLAALIAQAGLADKPVTSSNLSFTLVPRLNAAGRMGNAQLALDLLMCDDFAEATELAAQLEQTNTRRRTIESELADVAFVQSEEKFHGQRALVVSGQDWHEGVKGIVASRLCNTYGVPSILFTVANGEARGSGRSVGDVNLFKAVESCKDLLTRFGGHEAAVGVTLPEDKLPEFEQRLCAHMDTLDIESFQPRLVVDSVVDLEEMTVDNVSKLELLAPFGQENPLPKFMAQNVMVANARAVGADKTHLSCKLTDGVGMLACIMFRCPNIDELTSCQALVNAVFELQVDTWRGTQSVKAVVSEMKPAGSCDALNACLDQDDCAFMDGLLEREEPVASASVATFDGAGALDCQESRAVWAELAAGDRALLRTALVSSFLGEGSLHRAQEEALESLDAAQNTLCIMGTGRGKSLVFQIHAAEQALSGAGPSLLLYPLRALIHDQAHAMRAALAPFGLVVRVLCGDTPKAERDDVMEALANGKVDVVLTTPEYAALHAKELAAAARFSFLVVDEAHHVATSTEAFRPVYRRLGNLASELGSPVTLALSATVNPQAAQEIGQDLGIERTVRDDTERVNLELVDERNARRRDAYLANLCAQGQKTVIYVNSRMETVALTRALRAQVPQMAVMIGFYNAGLDRDERNRVEELFRNGSLQVLVATSAFGEGVNIPGIRNVVLYHMPFSEVEFNQMSGRAGRDGKPACIHLLYGRKDAQINEGLLREATPDHDAMAQIYRTLRRLQRDHGQQRGSFTTTVEQLAQDSSGIGPFGVSPTSVRCALKTFSELGLVEVRPACDAELDEENLAAAGGNASAVRIHVVDYQGKVELSQSVRYLEGLDERESFGRFCAWALDADAATLQGCIRHPLMP